MLRLILGFAVGLIVGWNLLPQPDWVKALYGRIVDRFRKPPEHTGWKGG